MKQHAAHRGVFAWLDAAQNGAARFAQRLLTLVMLGVLVVGGVRAFGASRSSTSRPQGSEETAFLVDKGSGFAGIATPLEERA